MPMPFRFRHRPRPERLPKKCPNLDVWTGRDGLDLFDFANDFEFHGRIVSSNDRSSDDRRIDTLYVASGRSEFQESAARRHEPSVCFRKTIRILPESAIG